MQSIVAIDIETTGLNDERDAVIEIGAVKFKGHRVEDEWSTLINPGRHIPEFITALTGISDVEVRHAPRLRDIAHELEAFVGDAPVVGHNIRFDLGFLQKQAGALQYNEVIDTYELAAVVMPAASRYNLGALGKQLGILLPATHRALDDARVTMAAFNRLLELVRELPLDLLAEIVRHGEVLEWDANWAFQEVLRSRAKEGIKAKKAQKPAPSFDEENYPPLGNPEKPIPLNEDEVASILEYGGPFSRYFESFEQRPEQIAMLRAVTNALSRGTHLMVEAGTGVGKSFAYLIPAALFALQNNTRVVVSTNTINLQDQLIQRDLPNLSRALDLDFRFSVLKGRSNYLCPRRLENMRHYGPKNADEMRVLAKVLVWQLTNSSGDRSEINLTGPTEREVWNRLSAEDDACTTETCIKRAGGACPFHRAKTASQSAHVLVVNHALLLSDVATGSKVLPEYSHLIIDEGHHLEAATTNALSFKLSQYDLERMMKEIGGTNSGVLGRLLGETNETLRPSDLGLLQQKVSRATDKAFRIEQMSREFFNVLGEFARIQREGQPQSNYAWQMRILPATRTLPYWDEVEMAWDATGETLRNLLNDLGEIHKAAAELYADGHDELEDVMGDISNAIRRLTEAEANITGMISKPNAGTVYWIEVQPNQNRLSLNAAPLSVAPLVEKYLWHEKRSVILTSATLTAHGEFQYLRNTLGADEADEMQLGSPYDYENAALLYIANDIPEPNQNGYEQILHKTILNAAKATGGRMLVLFTSYAALKKAAQAITAPLAREEIYVYEQGDGASPNALLESFKTTERAVLLGTKSFWEGVDVPGEALSVVVITKLPFDVPSDPLIAARSEMYEDPFNQYYLPEAILKFRQGFGRLIRTQSDRGVVAILDRRVLTKQYGRLFLESLPQCTARQGPAANLPREAAKWLGEFL
ncbi:MAG: helicase C-terminal domain-containing protein [Chloroflexota bacterium]|nr:3'-5' exoribonuclease [Chloroflexota bacterium]MBI5702704.1 3'-5' exoribonuclease [Chloroflexota bacterium]